MVNTEALIAHLKAHGFGAVVRLQYPTYDADAALEEMKTVGLARSRAFRIDEDNAFAYTNIAKWLAADGSLLAHNPDPDGPATIPGDVTKGLYIAGPAGTGKTWLVDIVQYLCHYHRIRFRIFDTDKDLEVRDYRADEITMGYAKTGDLEPFERERVLAVHDLGSEPEETLYMGNRVQPLRQLLEQRGDNNSVITIITSNLPMGSDALRARYGDRVASRLRQMCNYYVIKGRDRRR